MHSIPKTQLCVAKAYSIVYGVIVDRILRKVSWRSLIVGLDTAISLSKLNTCVDSIT